MIATTIRGTLAAAVAPAGTFTVSYPTGLGIGSFTGTFAHKLVVAQGLLSAPNNFSIAFGASLITITNQGAGTWAAGSDFVLQVNQLGTPALNTIVGTPAIATSLRCVNATERLLSLGSPVVGAANSISLSQSVTVGTSPSALLNGTTAGTLDVPRNVIAAWTGTAVLTVRGFDEYGAAMTESSASGTSLTGKKAFARVTSATFSADVTAATIGTGNVLGLPIYLSGLGFVTRELQDGAAPTAGTVVAGVQTAGGATATTGDVRGTYVPNATPDGSKSFQLEVLAPDIYLGAPQYAG